MHRLMLLWAAHNEDIWIKRQKRKISRRPLENINEMSEIVFIKRFRLDKSTFFQLCKELREHTSLRGTREIPVEIKVLCTLGFLATGSYQKVVGVTHHLTQRTASRCIRQVVEALVSGYMLKNIDFPKTLAERSHIKQEFQNRFDLPGVIGCIDCTHVSIVRPSKEDHAFINSQEYYSLNVQLVCDHNLRILNVNAKFGGAAEDSFIWASSQLQTFMRQLHESGEQALLLGDEAYPQEPWLMTPVADAAEGSPEEVYNTRHTNAQYCVKHCIQVLKARWKCLLKHNVLHYQPVVASHIISACCVLHNIAIRANVPPPVIDMAEHTEVENDVEAATIFSDELALGITTRDTLINSLTKSD